MKEQLILTQEQQLWKAPGLTQMPTRPYAEKRAMEGVENTQNSGNNQEEQKRIERNRVRAEGAQAELSVYLDKLDTNMRERPLERWTEEEKEKVRRKLQSLKRKVKKTNPKKDTPPVLARADGYSGKFKKDSVLKKMLGLGKKPQVSEEKKLNLELWYSRFTTDELKDPGLRQSIDAAVSLGHKPSSITSKGAIGQTAENVVTNSILDDKERVTKAEEIRNKLHEEEEKEKDKEEQEKERLIREEAVKKAHEEGKGEEGKDGKEAGVYNYTLSQLRRKAKILKGAGYSEEERRALMEAGIVGGEGGSGGDAESRPFSFKDIPADTPEKLRAKIAWNREVGGVLSDDPSEFQMIMAEIQAGRLPPSGGAESHGESAPRRERPQESESKPSGDGSSGGDPEINPYSGLVEQEKYLAESSVEATREHLIEGFIDQDMYGRKVNSIEVLAHEIMDNEKDPKYQIDAPLGLLKYKRDANNNIEYMKKKVKDRQTGQIVEVDTDEARVEFQADNFMHWVREWMMYWHDDSPEQEWDFGKQIGLKRDYNTIPLDQLINNPGRYFRSWTQTEKDAEDENGNKILDETTGKYMKEIDKETGEVVMENKVNIELVNQIKKELWLFGSSRSADIKYKLLMGDDEKLPQTIQELFYLNTFTKTVWDGRSGLYFMMSLPEKFKEVEGDVKGDTRLGQALNHAYQVYYNIADRSMLEELLGKDAPLLSGERILDTLQKMADEQKIDWDAKNPRDPNKETFIEPSLIEDLLDPEKGPKAIMKFVNFFDTQGTPDRQRHAVRVLVRESINQKLKGEGKEEFDKVNISYAEQFALSMARWTGSAARNDIDATGYDAWTRVQVTEEYRRKQLERKRGGAFGNPYTVNNLKQLGVDLFNGIQVQSMKQQDGKLRAKSVYEVLDEMQKADGGDDYHKAAAQLVFSENTMRGFANDHMARAFKVYQGVVGAEEINFDKFTHYDYVRGVTFDRAAFEEELKEKFFKPMRYGYSTYPMLDFGKVIRTDMAKGKEGGKFEDVHLAEAMFGREILEGAMWEDKEGHEHHFFKKGMEHISIDADNWAEKIDWEKVSNDAGRVAIWRQVALSRLSAQLYAHKDFHSTDPSYGWWYYNEIIEALEAVPGSIAGDEYDMKSSKAVGHFFTHHNIEWLRENSNTEMWRLYRTALISDLFTGSTKGFKDLLNAFLKGATSGIT